MKPQEYDKLVEKINLDLKKIRATKSHDYATDSDTLKNFKVTSSILAGLGYEVKGEQIKASDVAMFFEVIKLCRRANLRGREPDNESVLDSVEDNVNYTCLQYACLVDESPKPVTTEEIYKELGFKYEPVEEDKDWAIGYQNWHRVTYPEVINVAEHLVEKRNWKVKGFLNLVPGKIYQAAKDSSVRYTFREKEKESGLYRFFSSCDNYDIHFTEQGVEMLGLVEVE